MNFAVSTYHSPTLQKHTDIFTAARRLGFDAVERLPDEAGTGSCIWNFSHATDTQQWIHGIERESDRDIEATFRTFGGARQEMRKTVEEGVSRGLITHEQAAKIDWDKPPSENWLESAPGNRSARSFWHLFDKLRGLNAGLCWDVATSRDPPSVVVPVLNSRIRAIRLDTDHPHAREYLKRLRGIGFDGWVIFSRANATLDDFVAMKSTVMSWIAPAAKGKAAKK